MNKKKQLEETQTEVKETSAGTIPPVPPVEKPRSPRETLAKRLNQFRVALDNVLTDSSLQGPLTQLGYDTNRIMEGKTLYANAERLSMEKESARSKKFNASVDLNRIRDRVTQNYISHVKIARSIFKREPGLTAKLQLKGEREKALGSWLQQAQLFYDNALENPEILDRLNIFNFTTAELQKGKAMLDEVKAADLFQKNLKGEAQRLTDFRDRAHNELREWMNTFFTAARVAFKKDPQQLVKLQIVAG